MLRNKLFRAVKLSMPAVLWQKSFWYFCSSTKTPHRESALVYLNAVATVKVYNEKEIQSKHLI